MKNQLTAIAVSLFISLSVSAQTAPEFEFTFNGNILDRDTKRPLVSASVFISELKMGTVTDHHGEFHFRHIARGIYTVEIRYLGYEETVVSVEISKDTSRNFYLKPFDYELSEVTVTGKKDPTSLTGSSQVVTVLTSLDIDKKRGQTIAQVMENIPGVTTLNTGPSISKPVIRGLHSQRIIVLNDGVSQEGQQWGGEHAPEIDPFSPGEIQVLKGAAGVEYGANAIGGVIRIDQAPLPEKPGFSGKLSLNGFSNNRQGAGSLLVQGNTEFLPGFAYRFQGSARKAGNSQTPKHIIGNTGFTELNGSATAGYRTESFNFQTHFSHFGTELGIYSGAHIGNLSDLKRVIERGEPYQDYEFTYEIKSPKQNISHDLVSVHSDLNFPNLGTFELQYGWQKNYREEYDHKPLNDSLAALNKPSFKLTLYTNSVDLKFKHNPLLGFWGTFGLSSSYQFNQRGGKVFLIPDFEAVTGGIYLIENYLLDDWTFNSGIRYDTRFINVSENLNKTNPSKTVKGADYFYQNLTGVFGAIYRFSDTWSLAGNAGSAWRPPGINEMYSNDVHHGTAQYEIGDLNLKNERSYNIDLTLKHISDRTRGEISIYNNFYDNFIYLNPDTQFTLTVRGAFPTFRYVQANAVIRGIEGNLIVPVFEHQQIEANFSVTRGYNKKTNEPLIYMPADRVQITFHSDIPSVSWFTDNYSELHLKLVREQDQYPGNTDFSNPPSGYGVVDFDLGTRISINNTMLITSLSIQNIFNRYYRDYLSRYRYFIEDSGRNIILRIQIPFGNSD